VLGWWEINHVQAPNLGLQATCSVTSVSQYDSQTASAVDKASYNKDFNV